MIKTNKAGRRYEPETLNARTARSKELLLQGVRVKDIYSTIEKEFNGMSIGSGTLSILKNKLAKKAKKAQMELSFDAPAKTAPRPSTFGLSDAQKFAIAAAQHGLRCIVHPDGRTEVAP